MHSDCRPFIQPDTAMRTNRNGSKNLAITEVTLSPVPVGAAAHLSPNQAHRFFGHYGFRKGCTLSRCFSTLGRFGPRRITPGGEPFQGFSPGGEEFGGQAEILGDAHG